MEKDTQKGTLLLTCSKTAMRNSIIKFKCWSHVSWRQEIGLSTDNYALCSLRQMAIHSPKITCKKVHAILCLKGTAISFSTLSRRPSKEYELRSHMLEQKSHLTPDIIAIEHSQSGRKCCFLLNGSCSSLYLATLGSHSVRNLL